MIIEDNCRTKKIVAISSLTEDDKHILIWDFDDIKEMDVLKSLSKTQKINGLGPIYVFKSKHGYNAICLDKIDIEEANNIKHYTRFSDYTHTRIGYNIGSWCMRVGKDKQYYKMLDVCDTWKKRTQSNAHKRYLELEYNIDKFYGPFDTYTNMLYESYFQDVIP